MINFISIQTSHYVPVKEISQSRVRTGTDRVLAHRCGDQFAFIAKQNGRIDSVDDKAKVIKFTYKDGSEYVATYGSELQKNGGGGFFTEQNLVVNGYKAGDKFKKGDVLVYNPNFFTPDPFSKQVDLSLGTYATIALVENAYVNEDASLISKELSEKLEFYPAMERSVTINTTTNIHSIAMPGTKVRSIDPIIIFDDSGVSDEGLAQDEIDIIADLNRSTPKAKYSGEVAEIKVFYKGDKSSMSDSVRKVVNAAERLNKARAKAASGTEYEGKFLKPGPIESDKVDTTKFDNNTFMIKFYIKETATMGSGDKLVFIGSLKSVVSKVLKEEMITPNGVVVDAHMGATSVGNRKVTTPITLGCLERGMKAIEEKALAVYFE